MSQQTAVAVFGGGCFWCTEAVFQRLRGVIAVLPGYAGGTVAQPTYADVSSGKTGHAEVVRVEFDPSAIQYRDLLTVFFATHDPTTPNRQGQDVGPHYRSMILTTSDEQERTAQAFIRELSESDAPPVVTEVRPLGSFTPAEEEHRNYFRKNREASYCRLVIAPKLEELNERFAALLAHKSNDARP